jgi:hypothetical protein
MAVAMDNTIFWDVTPCSWVEIHVHPPSLGHRLSKQRGRIFLRNVGRTYNNGVHGNISEKYYSNLVQMTIRTGFKH